MCEDGGLQKALLCLSSGMETTLDTTIMKTTMQTQLQLRDWYS